MNKLFLIACLLIPNLLLSQNDEKIKKTTYSTIQNNWDRFFEMLSIPMTDMIPQTLKKI